MAWADARPPVESVVAEPATLLYGWCSEARYGKPWGEIRLGCGPTACDRQEHCLDCRGFALRIFPGVSTADAEAAHQMILGQLCRGGLVGLQCPPPQLRASGSPIAFCLN